MHQIGQLAVHERDVTLCFTVLRDIPDLLRLQNTVSNHAASLDFKGSIILCVGGEGARLCCGPRYVVDLSVSLCFVFSYDHDIHACYVVVYSLRRLALIDSGA
jgi:hypothetical protein